MSTPRAVFIYLGLTASIIVPVCLAANSPLLAWREPIYIFAGFAGIFAMVGLLLQPILATSGLPGIAPLFSKRLHRVVGVFIGFAVVLHVGGLWITSPPDVVDALLFRSPTPFSVWGVIAMWAVFLSLSLALMRRPLRLRGRKWQRVHLALAVVIVLCTVLHALLIQGTMETVSKWLLSVLVTLVVLKTVLGLWFGIGVKRKP